MVYVFAHRGSSGTCPENTLSAYKEAVEGGSDGIEIDVQYTKDNELVVIHDNTVNRTTNGKGLVKDYTLKELKMLDAGCWFSEQFALERIPTIEEVLAFVKEKEGLLLNIELKNVVIHHEGIEERVIKLVRDYSLSNRVIFSSFNHISLHRISKLAPEIECAVITLDKQFKPWDYLASVGAAGWHPQWSKIDQHIINEMKKRNHPVRVYTINKVDQMEAFLTNDIEAIMTDYPGKAVQIRNEIRRTRGGE
ncbi:glycerophosphoryl diester phosphodiesterase [Oceanobacillus picturae]|uniref:Glycerophosphoryl diester phosphodiesterase n=1 Tax=Oceanobacillus picturae TaxID=171693 RepID=A0A0U9HYF6_9BACI|nr:glycerophosphodiester phosphodiesterase [Oceanobacillus picturae]RIU94846.1 glycerophosphodiester phosphodiesterase [Oceanobacillus picturae]GAQ16941.1 glycerophosphoryl diester phosphodiesterase [Oceanobacillus picturae]